jgi:hypothetical protein
MQKIYDIDKFSISLDTFLLIKNKVLMTNLISNKGLTCLLLLLLLQRLQ